MPGLVGFVKQIESGGAPALLESMALALEPSSRFRRELVQNGQMGLGRVSLKTGDPGSQPVWSQDRSLCLVMEGEFYDVQALKQELAGRGYPHPGSSDAELALNLFQEFGEDFAARTNGSFVIAIWEAAKNRLLIVNDRLGLHPLYYAPVDGGLLFASGVRALLADPDLPRQVDEAAIAQFLTFDHVLHDRTLLEQAKLLPQASVLSFSEGQLNIRPYWTLQYARQHSLCSERQYLEGLLHYLRQAIRRQAQTRGKSAGLLLSGGLDSRFLLALFAEVAPELKLHTFTWGIPGCDDARFARECAAVVGAEHHFFELKPNWLLGMGEEGVRLTDGMGNVINLHAMAAAEEEAAFASVLYKGFLGDAMFGFAVELPFWADFDEPTQTRAHFQAYLNRGVITFLPREQEMLFTEAFRQQVGDTVLVEMKRGMQAAGASQVANQRLYFDLTQRVPRMTINGVEVVRSHATVRLPFGDKDLVDFACQLPPGMQYNRHLITQAFLTTYPNLAKIPNTATGLPYIACGREVALRARQLIQWHLRKKGLERLAGPQRRPYKDYNGWFRTVLREWVEDTLLSQRALQRPYFNAGYVRDLVAEHMAGSNHAVKLGALLSIELWHRQFLD